MTFGPGFISPSVGEDRLRATRSLTHYVLTLQPDATAGMDAYFMAGAPTLNNNDANLRVGYFNATYDHTRSLIKFDLSTIPTTALVTSAILSLWVAGNYGGANHNEAWYRVRRAWTETGVTHNKYDGTNTWGTAGCNNVSTDREAGNIGSVAVAGNIAAGTQKDWSLTSSAVQEWVSGAFTNNGLILISDNETTNDLIDWRSSDSTTAAFRPKLVVEYDA